jgi:N-acetylglucosaminyldiphosphoundecaprenol N-acetyl-beta-D-mannosaminyltransferase
MDKVNILGAPVTCAGKDLLLEQAQVWSRQRQARLITYVNAHCLNVAHTDPAYLELLKTADLVYADGFSVVFAARFLYGARLEKITGRDWIYDFSRMAAEADLKVYILAGRPGVAQKAGSRLRQAFPGLQIVGARDGYFIGCSEEEVLREIRELRPQVVLVGMGIPLQEKWLAVHRTEIQAPVCWAVGALFDYVAGFEPPVPYWLNALAMEWLWRLILDPTGKWRRYLVGLPLFALRLIRQKQTQKSVSPSHAA